MSARFRTLDEYRAERSRSEERLRRSEAAMARNWDAIRDKEFRHAMAWSAGEDLIQAWRPLRMVGTLINSEKGLIGNLVAGVIGSRGRSFKGKLLAWATAAIVPYLIKRFATSEHLASFMSGAQDAWDSFTGQNGSKEEEEDLEEEDTVMDDRN